MTATRAVRGFCVAFAAVALLAFAFVAASRATFAFELEWMEGGMLTHAARALRGEPIYAQPSVDFVPYFYTPLYSYVLAALSLVTGGLSFFLGRAVSVLATCATLAMIFLYVRRESNAAFGFFAAGVFAAHFRMAGAFMDLVRPDALGLALVFASFFVMTTRSSKRSAVLAALLAVAAFFTKQTMAVFVPAIALGVAFDDKTRAALYLGVAACLGVATGFVVDVLTAGWFRFYIVEGHQGHLFLWSNFLREYWRDVLFLSPMLLVVPLRAVLADKLLRWLLPLGVVVVVVAIHARASEIEFGPHMYYDEVLYHAKRGVIFVVPLVATALLLAGVSLVRGADRLPRTLMLFWGAGLLASALNHSTQWAYSNCFLPAVLGAAPAIALTVHRVSAAYAHTPRAALASAFLCAGLLTAAASLVYNPIAQVPSATDREARDAVEAELAALGDNVWVPAHPFSQVARDGAIYAHQMGLGDVSFEGGLSDLRERLAAREWSAIVLDGAADIPELRDGYRRLRRIPYATPDALMPRTGFRTRPEWVWVPR